MWGTDLWDQEKEVGNRLEKEIDFLLKCRDFVKTRASIEASYAQSLRKLVRDCLPDCQKKLQEDGRTPSTLGKAWETILNETNDIAKQHEIISENFVATIVDPLKALAKEKKSEKKQLFGELADLQAELEKSKKKYEHAKKTYDKSVRDAHDADEKYNKVQVDGPRAKAEKALQEKRRLEREQDDAKTNYRVATHDLNLHQQKFYSESSVQLLNAVQASDEDRTTRFRDVLDRYCSTTEGILSIVHTCQNNMKAAVEAVDAGLDAKTFSEDRRTGLSHPGDIQVCTDAPSPTGKTVHKINERRVKKKKFFYTTTRKKDAVREDFGHLPPEQRKKAIEQKLADLKVELETASKTKEGYEKTVELYTKQPLLGTDKAIKEAEAGMNEADKSVKALGAQIYKFELYLAAMVDDAAAPHKPAGYRDSTASQVSYAGQEDYEEDEEEYEYEYEEGQAEEEEGYAQQEDYAQVEDTAEVTFVGYGTAIYDFPGTNDGELCVSEGDRLTILVGDNAGWLHADKDGVAGYVPTSYVTMDEQEDDDDYC